MEFRWKRKMGIKSLNTFISKKAPSGVVDIEYNTLAGEKIAIDSNNWLYRYVSVLHKRLVFKDHTLPDYEESMLRLLRKEIVSCIRLFKNDGVIPVFIIDGAKDKIDKNECIQKRCQIKTSRQEQADNMLRCLESTKDDDSDSTAVAVVNATSDSTVVVVNATRDSTVAVVNDKTETTIEKYKNKLAYCFNMSPRYFELLQECCDIHGIECYVAEGEGEKECSRLCIENKVYAVLSTDTDNLAYGCPRLITKIFVDNSNKTKKCTMYYLDDILSSLQFTYTQFLEFCIMCGCDFNTNVPGIGPVKAYKLIQMYKTISSIPSTVADTSCLNYDVCRRIFSLSVNPMNDVSTESMNPMNDVSTEESTMIESRL